MSDIREVLTAEAQRLQPAEAPEFAELLAARGRRRRYAMAASAAVLVAGAMGGTALMVHTGGPQDHTGPVRAPAAAGVPVSGMLQQIGGPAGVGSRKIAGVVHFRSAEGVVTSADVASDGRFSLIVPSGRYQVTGTPAANPSGICGTDSDVVVPAAGLDGVQVNCHVR